MIRLFLITGLLYAGPVTLETATPETMTAHCADGYKNEPEKDLWKKVCSGKMKLKDAQALIKTKKGK